MKRLSDYYSVAAAAEETGIEYKTLLKRIERGTVEYEPFGRMKLIPTAEVKRLKSELRVERVA